MPACPRCGSVGPHERLGPKAAARWWCGDCNTVFNGDANEAAAERADAATRAPLPQAPALELIEGGA